MLSLQAGQRSLFLDPAAFPSISATQRSMQSSWASRVQGQGFTHSASGVSTELSRQMKHTRTLGSDSEGCRRREGMADGSLVGAAASSGLDGGGTPGAFSALLPRGDMGAVAGSTLASISDSLAITSSRSSI